MVKSSQSLIKASHLSYSIQSADQSIPLIKNCNLDIGAQEIIAIRGKSGVGKTTLLNLLAGFITPTSGEVELFGQKIKGLTESQKNQIRGPRIGFVFQDFQLIQGLNAFENVLLPLALHNIKHAEKVAKEWLNKLELNKRHNHLPSQLSGGEQQRVGLARAFALQPKIIFADEPTGQLDDATSKKLHLTIHKIQEQCQTTLVIATHDDELVARAKRVFDLKTGVLKET